MWGDIWGSIWGDIWYETPSAPGESNGIWGPIWGDIWGPIWSVGSSPSHSVALSAVMAPTGEISRTATMYRTITRLANITSGVMTTTSLLYFFRVPNSSNRAGPHRRYDEGDA